MTGLAIPAGVAIPLSYTVSGASWKEQSRIQCQIVQIGYNPSDVTVRVSWNGGSQRLALGPAGLPYLAFGAQVDRLTFEYLENTGAIEIVLMDGLMGFKTNVANKVSLKAGTTHGAAPVVGDELVRVAGWGTATWRRLQLDDNGHIQADVLTLPNAELNANPTRNYSVAALGGGGTKYLANLDLESPNRPYFSCSANSDVAGTMYIELSHDAATWNRWLSYPVPGGADGANSGRLLVPAPYVRAYYVNGGVAQGWFQFFEIASKH